MLVGWCVTYSKINSNEARIYIWLKLHVGWKKNWLSMMSLYFCIRCKSVMYRSQESTILWDCSFKTLHVGVRKIDWVMHIHSHELNDTPNCYERLMVEKHIQLNCVAWIRFMYEISGCLWTKLHWLTSENVKFQKIAKRC